MSYTLMGLLGVAFAAIVDVVVLRTYLFRRKAFWMTYAIVFAFQIVTNGLLTGLGIVRYDPRRILGWRIAYAPVEDLLFGFAMVTVTLSLWVWTGRRDVRSTRSAAR